MEFCSLWWHAEGYPHGCMKVEGHEGPHTCCDEEEGGFPGGKDWTGAVYKSARALFAAREASDATDDCSS